MKSAYELYTEWTKGRSRVAEGGIFKTVSECELEAFRAGMLAAADIVVDMIADGRRAGIYEHLEYADAIREAAK